MNRRYLTKILAVVTVCLVTLIFLVIIVSWIVAALSSDTGVHSLLSSEGVRWLFGSFTSNVAGQLLIWLILLSMALGVVERSALLSDWLAARKGHPLSYRQRYAYRIVFFLFACFIIAALLLTVMPHAVLLSVTGHLFPSSFSSSLVPMIALVAIVVSGVYGTLCGNFGNIADILTALSKGISSMAPFFLPFLLAEELWHIVFYVFR